MIRDFTSSRMPSVTAPEGCDYWSRAGHPGIVAERRRGGSKLPNGRLMWTASGSRLWDREGVEWQDAEVELSRSEAEQLLTSSEVPVVVSMGAGPLRWL